MVSDSFLSGTFGQWNFPRNLKVRQTGPSDAPRVMAFYASNPHPSYAPRDITHERVRDGHALIVEDSAGSIWAASIDYEMAVELNSQGGVKNWSEIGTTRSILNGCGIYQLINAVQALTIHFDYPPSEFIYLDIHESNEKAIGLMNKTLQWKDIQPCADLFSLSQGSLSEEKQGIPVKFFQCTEENLTQMARIILDVINADGLTHKSGQSIEVDLSDLSLVHTHFDKLKELAAQAAENDNPFDNAGVTEASLLVHTCTADV